MHVIRNAGGRAIEAVRSLVISQQLLGTREVRQPQQAGFEATGVVPFVGMTVKHSSPRPTRHRVRIVLG